MVREFIYYSKNAITTGKFDLSNLMKAGRMDIACNVIIATFFLSHDMRKDVKLHMIFDGPPSPPMHLIFEYDEEMSISKKNVAGLIKKMLYKCPKEQGSVVKVFPGCSIEKKSFEALIKELDKQGKNIFVLGERGQDIRKLKLAGNEVFVLGDHDGFPGKEKFVKNIEKISVGPRVLFASQVLVLINNEIDRSS